MVIIIVALLFFIICFGWILLDMWEESVMWRRGMAIAESVALEGLRHKHLPEYTPPGHVPYSGAITSGIIWDRLVTIAATNGLDPRWFYSLATTNISASGSVT